VTEPPFPIVLVHWVDSMTLESGGWMDVDDVEVNVELDAMRQESVGYLVRETKAGLALADSRNASLEDDDHNGSKVGGVTVIPRVALLGPPIPLLPRRRRPRAPVTTSTARVTAEPRRVRQSSPRSAPLGRRTRREAIPMAARKNSTTKAAEAKQVDLRKQLTDALAEQGIKAKAKDAPSKNYAALLVDGKNIGYVFKQTKQGVRVLVALQPGDMPKSIKGFKASGRSGAFGAMGGFDEKTLSHAVAALALSATRQADAKTAKAEAKKAEPKPATRKPAAKRNGAKKDEAPKDEPKPETPAEAPAAEAKEQEVGAAA
jgi:hypothetical protein